MIVSTYIVNTNSTFRVDTDVSYTSVLEDRLQLLQDFADRNTADSAVQAVASHPAISSLSGKTDLGKLVYNALWGKGGLVTQAKNSLNGSTKPSSRPKSATVKLVSVKDGEGSPIKGVFECSHENYNYCVRGKLEGHDLGRDLGDAEVGSFKYDLRLVKHIIQVGLNLPRYERVYCNDWILGWTEAR